MTDALRSLMETLGRLPECYQEEAIRRIRPIVDELDERAWDEAFADPRSEAFFAEAEAQLERERAAGTLVPLDNVLSGDE